MSDAVLVVDEDLQTCESGMLDGWQLMVIGSSNIPVYCKNGKALVGLERIAPNTINVHVRKAIGGYLSIGLQYGLIFALTRECFGLHGVTLLCENEIIVLSAPSGTGKTTLSKLLEKYCDAIVINGDFALLHPTEEGVIFEPTPFCGSSGRCLNHRFRIDRVVFLGQAKENVWRNLDSRDAMKKFLNNCFVPTWDCAMQEAVRSNVFKGVELLQVNAYDFAPTKAAAEEFLLRITQL